MSVRITVGEVERCIGCYSCMLACARLVHKNLSPLMSAVQVTAIGGPQGRLLVSICRSCEQPLCAVACPTGALTPKRGGGVTLDRQRCKGCGQCSKGCPTKALPIRGGYPLVCKQCGKCAAFCPQGIFQLINTGTGGINAE